jgi:hypothetical protein
MSDAKLLTKRLATQYVGDASELVKALQSQYPYENLLRAVIERKVPRQGVLQDDLRFEFHGVGCRFETPSRKLDLDFGPECRCDGFDAWRLYLYANENNLGVGNPTLAEIEEGLIQLERAGEVQKPRTDPSPHLYYFC